MDHDCFGCGHANKDSFDVNFRLFDLDNLAGHRRG